MQTSLRHTHCDGERPNASRSIADPSSLVGSVGVISRGFGYVKAIKKQGVSRRVHTAGEQKSGLDPYMPVRRRDLASQTRLLNEIHTKYGHPHCHLFSTLSPGRNKTNRLSSVPPRALTVPLSRCRSFIAAVREGRGDRLQPEAAARLYHTTTSGSSGWWGSPSSHRLSKLVDRGAGLFDGSVRPDAWPIHPIPPIASRLPAVRLRPCP